MFANQRFLSAALKAVNERKHTFHHATGTVEIQNLDKYMAILCYDDDNEITDYFRLWAWKADKDSSSLCSLTDLIFPAEDRFLLANGGTTAVFSFAGDRTLLTLQCTAKLVMPTSMQDWKSRSCNRHHDEFPRRWVESGNSMFHLTADDQLLVFHVAIYRMMTETVSTVFHMGETPGALVPRPLRGLAELGVRGPHGRTAQRESNTFLSTEPCRLRLRNLNPNLVLFHSSGSQRNSGRERTSVPT